jgi:transposase IS116/IS110/IS902 family protein
MATLLGAECRAIRRQGFCLPCLMIRRRTAVSNRVHPSRRVRARSPPSRSTTTDSAAIQVLDRNGCCAQSSTAGQTQSSRSRICCTWLDVAVSSCSRILVGADPALRESLTGLGPGSLIRACAALDDPAADVSEVGCTVIYTLRLLANRILALKAEAYELHKRLRDLTTRHNPQLLERPGVGPDSAAALLIAAGDKPQRLRREGSYAALCGVSPVEASSGNTQRRRLNPGGDRQANAALYRITLSRLRWDQRTQDYLQRRVHEGKTRREAIRCVKRYIAREIFGILAPRTQSRPSIS